MMLTIARKEAMETFRDGRLRWGAGLVAMLLFLSLATGWTHYQTLLAARSKAEAQLRDQWLNRQSNNAHVAAHAGTVLLRPYSALSTLDKGIDSYVGTSLFLEAHRVNDLDNRRASRSSTLQQLGEVSVATVLQTLLPLIVILMVFATFAGERESGTLRMLLSTGVQPRQLLLGKALGAVIPLLAVLVPSVSLGVIALFLHQAEGGITDRLPRTLLLVFSYGFYLAAFMGLAFLVSMRAASSRRALAALLAFWFCTGLALPRALLEIGARLYNTAPPPAANPADAAAKAHAYIERYGQRMNELERELLAKYNVKTRAELPVSITALMLASSEEEDTKQQRAQFARLQDKFAAQERLYQAAGFFSPAIAIQSISAGLAGSDLAHYRHFAEAAEEYRYRVVQKMNDDLIHHPYTDAKSGTAAYRAREKALYESVGPFEYVQPGWTWAARHFAIAAQALALWCLALPGLIWLSLRRLGV